MKKLLFLFLAISIVSCKNSEKKAKEISKPEVKIYQLVGGSILVKKLEVFSQDTTYTGQSKLFTDIYYVISHPKGNLMWDAGLPEQLVIPQPYDEPSGVYRIQRPDSLVNQLKSIGFKIEDFTHFAMSHSHFDHTGHANYLKNATWLVQENEYNSVAADTLANKNPAVAELKKVKKLHGDYDVFEDGSVIIKYTPGHTVGHQALYVEVSGVEKPILLTGDLYHFKENRTNKVVPSFNYNVQQTLESMDAFEAFAKEKNAQVIIQHSPEDFKELNKLLGYTSGKTIVETPNFTHEGEFVYIADAATFKDCASGKTYSVSGNEAYLILEKAYLNAKHKDFEPKWVQVVAEMKQAKGIDNKPEEQLIVTQFVSLDENKKCK